jgi:hypothetical protein
MTYALATNGYICLGTAIAAFTGERVKPSALKVVAVPLTTAKLQVTPELPPTTQPEPTPPKPQVSAAVERDSTAVLSVGEAAPAPPSPAEPLEPTGPPKPTVKVSTPTVKVRKP